jgi:hypothetical protein
MNLSELIDACIAKKNGNREFALFHLDPDDWRAEIGNPSQCVMLGEACGEFEARGRTAEEAVSNLLKEIS